MNAIRRFFSLPFFRDFRTLAVLWLILAVIATLAKGGLEGGINNFKIFRAVYLHMVAGQSLYAYYPAEYMDHNLYGPSFALVVAPFALLPRFWGLLLWNIAMAAVVFIAIYKLPLPRGARIFTMWFVSNEVISSLFMAQFNMAVCAIMLGAFIAMRSRRWGWFAFCLALGTLTKIYGIMALAFIPFIHNKWKAAAWTVGWTAVLLVAPLLIAPSAHYLIGQYTEWIATLMDKNSLNAEALYQNISFIGMAHRISGAEFPDIYILIPAALLFLLPAVRIAQFKNVGFQWALLASALMVIILFSTGSESSGYIIALTGVALWYLTAPWQRSTLDVVLLIFALVLSSFGGTDIVPRFIRKGYVIPYALKALPITLIWLKLIWEMCTRSYAPSTEQGK